MPTPAQQRSVDLLKQALTAIEDAAVPVDLRPIAFSKVFDYLSPATLSAAERTAGNHPEDHGDAATAPIVQIAAKLGVDPALVQRVYDVDDDGVHLTVSRSALHPTKGTAAQQVARLTMAGRQALGMEEFTPAKILRAACEGRGVLDGHFAEALAGLDGNGVRVRGTGANREAKLNAHGYELAGADVKHITGGA